MKITEFLHNIRGSSNQNLCLGVLYFEKHFRTTPYLKTSEIKGLLHEARIRGISKWNISDILTKSTPYVAIEAKEKNKFIWVITKTGENYLEENFDIKNYSIENIQDISSLEALTTTVSSEDIAEYINESLKCLRAGALRATIVFLWQGAIRVIQEKILVIEDSKNGYES